MSGDDGAREMVILSAAGGVIVLTLAWLGRTENGGGQLAGRLIVGGALLASFLFGISLATRPRWLRGLRRDAVHSADASPPRSSGRARHGHHPDCEHFESHTVRFGGKVLCAGCAGLSMGSAVSMVLVGFYIALQIDISPDMSLAAVWMGAALVAVSVANSELLHARGSSRLISNLVMPVGFFLVAVGLLEATGNAAYGLMGVVICFLWLDTRIRLSRRRHIRICSSCDEACKSYLA